MITSSFYFDILHIITNKLINYWFILYLYVAVTILSTHILMYPVLIIVTTKIMVNYIYYDVKRVHSNKNVFKILSILFVVSKRRMDLHFSLYSWFRICSRIYQCFCVCYVCVCRWVVGRLIHVYLYILALSLMM